MSKTVKTVQAGGGVLWRPAEDGTTEVCLVHRPRYDDWTLPKGKAESGETLIATGARELEEETGYRVALGRHLRDVVYELPTGGRKHVRYWAARPLGGDFEPSHEVDRIRWLPVDKASEKLSYRLDRSILREFARLPADLTTMLLVRHARAGRRSRYHGDDRLRPLDSLGRAQADALVTLLRIFDATTLHAADRVRCEQTIAPAAAALATPILGEPTLSEEAYRENPDGGRQRIREIAEDSSTVHAICSQGKVIPPLMQWWSDEDGVTLPRARNRKASVWVVSLHAGRMVAADHIDSPLPAT